MGTLVGYSRVSTGDHTVEPQEDALRAAGCTHFYRDTLSGAKTERPGLNEALAYLRSGDTLVVCKLDRLGRSICIGSIRTGACATSTVSRSSLICSAAALSFANEETSAPGGGVRLDIYDYEGQAVDALAVPVRGRTRRVYAPRGCSE